MLARVFLLVMAVLVGSAGPAAGEPVDFAKRIQPIFVKNCVSCHGAAKQKAGLRLDFGTRVLKGSVNGPVVVAGKAAESKLVHSLKGEMDADQMPPSGALDAAEIALIARWIDEGTKIPAEKDTTAAHWSFVPPKQAPVPKGVHLIDHFLDAERTKRGVKATEAADPGTLVRRLHLDLTGLPPTPADIASYRAEVPNAYAKKVDALLASPRYGERWGRHFLDVWRYSDWYGYQGELRNSQKHIWNWRDWVVESLNGGKPYDAMVREMLAGDEIAPDDPKVLRATGYLARSFYTFNRNIWLDDVVEHTGKAFLGITLNCARCHDHMYDPIAQEDYFRFRAIFEPHRVRLDPVPGESDPEKRGLPRVYDAEPKTQTFLFERGDDKRPVKDKPLPPGVPAALGPKGFAPVEVKFAVKVAHPTLRDSIRDDLLAQAERTVAEAKVKKTDVRIRAAEGQLEAVKAKLAADRARYSEPAVDDAADRVHQAVTLHLESDALDAEANFSEAEEALKKLEEAAKKDPKAVDAQKKKVTAAKTKAEAARKACDKPPSDYPTLVPGNPAFSTGRRSALANWIVSKENPLTARVFVNHVWMRHFGQPLVTTVFDFGKNGRPPSHPALLDWLAVEFMKSGWDVKKLHRLILTSNAYRMRSTMAGADAEANRKLDPDNLLLWRMNPRALEAEAIRDSLLAVSGLLDPTAGGPELDFNDDAPTLRRSLYYRHAPEKMMPFLLAFDAAEPTDCYRRANTVVPQQAMALVNSRISARAAEAVAKGLTSKEPGEVVAALYKRLLGREPTETEAELCAEFLKANPPAALVQALFNHADFSTIR
jgi:mono/diheme cytochrome c family protein